MNKTTPQGWTPQDEAREMADNLGESLSLFGPLEAQDHAARLLTGWPREFVRETGSALGELASKARESSLTLT